MQILSMLLQLLRVNMCNFPTSLLNLEDAVFFFLFFCHLPSLDFKIFLHFSLKTPKPQGTVVDMVWISHFRLNISQPLVHCMLSR